MNSNLQFDFTVDKAKQTVNVTREFAADLDLVWAAWTQPELLDQWWAPKPYRTETKSMDFRAGGRWFYSMIGPEGVVHYCCNEYEQINPKQSFSGLDAFCHEDGTINDAMPRTFWTNEFSEKGGHTTVAIVAQYNSLEDLEMVISMGFKEGFSMALENLDQYLEAQQKLRQQNQPAPGPKVCTYLNFPGNTEEAMLFYQSVFRTEFLGSGMQRFGDIPSEAGHPPVAENVKKMILHAALPITGNHILMASDAPKEMGFEVIIGNNMHISIETASKEEANRVFSALSNGGHVTMPLQDMFWGAYYGSLTDQFGINWMVNFPNS